MTEKKKILAISGSTRSGSSNSKLLQIISEMLPEKYEMHIFKGIDTLPHFNPDLDTDEPPVEIQQFRQQIAAAVGVIICTPEYVFSMPGSLKNALEWMVSTVIFSDKPVGLITAAASGEMGHEELKLVMRTIQTIFNDDTQLLINGIKGKFDADGKLVHKETLQKLHHFATAFENLAETQFINI